MTTVSDESIEGLFPLVSRFPILDIISICLLLCSFHDIQSFITSAGYENTTQRNGHYCVSSFHQEEKRRTYIGQEKIGKDQTRKMSEKLFQDPSTVFGSARLNNFNVPDSLLLTPYNREIERKPLGHCRNRTRLTSSASEHAIHHGPLQLSLVF